ncbi:MAG: hypothetical protein CMM07_25790 [Rhodopirellula sp.]|nr:hypothetical protein [Rhodopirellula sp.]
MTSPSPSKCEVIEWFENSFGKRWKQALARSLEHTRPALIYEQLKQDNLPITIVLSYELLTNTRMSKWPARFAELRKMADKQSKGKS